MRHSVSAFAFAIVLLSALLWQFPRSSIVFGQTDPLVPVGMQLYPVNVQAGGSMIATFFAHGDTRSAYFDVRFREPGSLVDQIAENWQQGSLAAHAVPVDTTPGTYVVTGIRAHGDPVDHNGDFVPLSASVVVSANVQRSGIFAVTGPMNEVRMGHTATLLADGRVLIAGGRPGQNWALSPVRASAELYDPATGVFVPSGMMAKPRTRHTATLLPSGRVLITGGYSNGFRVESSAELYDPATGAFTPTGNMTVPRSSHSAILLPSGDVLIVGSGLERYDTISGTFTPIDSLGSQSPGQPNLIIGGLVFFGFLVGDPYGATPPFSGRGLLYDPVSGGVADIRQNVGQAGNSVGNSATLLSDGKVLLAGGVFGGDGVTNPTGAVFDPASASFSPTGEIPSRHVFHTATLLPDGEVLFAGGDGDPAADLYDPITRTFRMVGAMAFGVDRAEANATLLRSGDVLITGGYSLLALRGVASAALYHRE